MGNILIAVCALAAALLAGYLASLRLLEGGKGAAAERLAASFGLGTGLIYVEMLALSWAGVPLAGPGWAVMILADLFILALLDRRFLARGRVISVRPRPTRLKPAEWVFLAVIAANVAMAWLYALRLPAYKWDAVAIWGLKGKILFHETVRESAYFSDPTRSYSHPDYPLLFPLLQAYLYRAMGSVDDRAVKVLYPAYGAFLLLSVYGAARRLLPRSHALFFTALLASSRAFYYESASGYADVPLAFYSFGMSACLYLWMREGDERRLVLSALCGGLAIATKNEGLMIAAINVAVLLLFLARRPAGARARPTAIFAGFALLVGGPWYLFRRLASVIVVEDYVSRLNPGIIVHNAGRLPAILKAFAAEAASFDLWNVLWPAAALSVLFGLGHALRSLARYLLILVAAQVGMYILIYIATPWDPSRLIPSTLTRLMIPVAPVAILLACACVGENGRLRTEG